MFLSGIKTALIDGVTKLIRDLPIDAKYDFGFVRPVDDEGNSKPEADVFLSENRKANIRCLSRQSGASERNGS